MPAEYLFCCVCLIFVKLSDICTYKNIFFSYLKSGYILPENVLLLPLFFFIAYFPFTDSSCSLNIIPTLVIKHKQKRGQFLFKSTMPY